MNERTVQVLSERAARLGALKHEPAWQELRAEFERKKERINKGLTARNLTGGWDSLPVNQREFDYQKGFLAGAQWILDNPERAETTLEVALRKAEVLDQESR